MENDAVYICDADSLINIHRCYPKEFSKLRKFILKGLVKIPQGVMHELKKGTDKLADNLEKLEKKSDLVIYWDRNPTLCSELSRIEILYGEKIVIGGASLKGFWKSKAGRKSADGQVITCAKVYNYIVVTDDKAIESACMLEDIACIGWMEFARRIGLFKKQLSLFEHE